MELAIFGKVVSLRGDWRLIRVTQSSIHLLADSLEQISSGTDKNPQIDCKQISRLDIGGLELLYTWFHCFRLRGIEPVLINPPEKIQKAFHGMDFLRCA